ncbi:MAG: LacI family DNA-binding transcriptional regulator [Microbacterium sp.]|uniref:LacI family DNA-binding transcriptional regulator n=1 Tax=Microbacterium sp. TaxID=51671 RepID=UPI001AD321A0|nr:LacI family DNA-binding transcriptional regulator [Microbacterium sp.]MBN9153750.1 LacI family DNA-binding transcriptional regulator [Microbacterium sp.]MBN9171169.1 LacI family DNA-binding transcriptional regulator [Microbacterium sp.]MBN9173134.1 LacI family DNA-binding transcriptional regulator [Microbacterium sp.]MBN9183746.1 LacI family DNA-binding transcriptional regulator [Microbacterium sp.]MBN9192372.1 LacI family DNA-binding transcriptional regulator [Microbacterium sp.]
MSGRSREPATIEEVAAVAGVSRSTVSRVVNGSTAVSPSALDAVQRAIAELSYVPNRAARSLASRQTLAIALVVPEDTTRFFGDPFFAAIVSGINARLQRSDYVLNLFIANDDPGDKMASYIRGGNVDGAIIVSHHTSDTFVDRIAASVPVVYGGRPVRHREGDYYVDVDNVAGGRAATEYLLSRGHRRIAMIAGPLTMPPGVDRLEGYRQALSAAEVAEGPVEDGEFTTDGGAAAMRRILDAGDPPDAVFVASDLMARGALATLAAAGLRVPEDVAVLGFDDSPVATSVSPQLTTMRQPSFDEGEAMASTLLELLAGRQPRHATIMAAELVVRESA